MPSLVTALDRFGVPLYLSGMARGLMVNDAASYSDCLYAHI